jgi:hypothetical protein
VTIDVDDTFVAAHRIRNGQGHGMAIVIHSAEGEQSFATVWPSFKLHLARRDQNDGH